MSKPPSRKPLKWVGSAKRDLDAMPDDVKDVFGYAIDLAQAGGKHIYAKPLSGFGSAGVLEVVEDFQGDTYRAVYTVRSPVGCTFCTASRRSRRAGSRRHSWTSI